LYHGEELHLLKELYSNLRGLFGNVYVDYYFKHAAIIEAIRIFCQLARESEYWPMSQEEMEKSRKNRLEEFAEVVFE